MIKFLQVLIIFLVKNIIQCTVWEKYTYTLSQKFHIKKKKKKIELKK